MNSPCKAEVLSYLVNTKEFRIIPTPIWRQVQSNAALSVESRFLWTVLWELCSLQSNFEKSLTWGFLSKRVGKSESTIRRWARALQRLGYLEIRSVYDQEGGQLPSLFRIGVPAEVAENVVKAFPDRRKKYLDNKCGTGAKPAAETPKFQENTETENCAENERKKTQPDISKSEIQDQPEKENCKPQSQHQDKPENCGRKDHMRADKEIDKPNFQQRAESAEVEKEIIGRIDLEEAEQETNQLAEFINSLPEVSDHADSAVNAGIFHKFGVDKNPMGSFSRLAKRIGRVAEGAERSLTKRSEDRQALIPNLKDHTAREQSDGHQRQLDEAKNYDHELEEIRRRAGDLTKRTWLSDVTGEGVRSIPSGASKDGTQNNNTAKQENNKQRCPLRAQLRRVLAVRLGVRNDLEKLVDEFAVSVEKGAFKKFDLVKAINIGIKLVQEGRWATPRFMP